VIARLLRSSEIAAFVACVLTPVGYMLAARHPGRLASAFQDRWEIIGALVALAVLGLQEVIHGLYLCFTVGGSFQKDNLKRGAASVASGFAISTLGVVVLSLQLSR
jgi:hypothetical protein